MVRAGVMTPLYLAGEVLALGVAKVVLGWPMVLVVIWLSWLTIRRTLPEDHPGIFGVRSLGGADAADAPDAAAADAQAARGDGARG